MDGEIPISVRSVLTWPTANAYPSGSTASAAFASHRDALHTSLAAVLNESGPLREGAVLTLTELVLITDSSVEKHQASGEVNSLVLRLTVEAAPQLRSLSRGTIQRLASTIESFAKAKLGPAGAKLYRAQCEPVARSEPKETKAAATAPVPASTTLSTPAVAGKLVVGALILKGGGVKGLAFAGALSVLEKYYDFRINAGTSAGAIVATLRGAGYTSAELIALLRETDFRSFLDSPKWWAPFRFVLKGALHSGRQCWLRV